MTLGARPLIAALVLCIGAFALQAACNEGNKKMTPPPFESKSSPWKELTIPGVELFLEHESSPPHRVRATARVEGASSKLSGKEAFDATRAKAGNDATALATLAMLFLDEGTAGKLPWTKPIGGARPPDQEAIARPPVLSGDTLVYWRAHVQLADLVRCKVSLSTGQITCELGGDVLQGELASGNPAEAAKQYLASEDVHQRIRGIQLLGQVKDDRAREQLIDIALNKFDQRERQAAVEVLGKTGGTGVVAALSRVLLFDRYAEVRQAAAVALGELRDPAGREALEKAEKGDANGRVQVLAAEALKKLR